MRLSGWAQNREWTLKVYYPLHRITADTPPIITIHGKIDSVVPFEQAETLHKKLTETGRENDLVCLETGKHLGFSDAEFRQAYARIFAFLERQTDL